MKIEEQVPLRDHTTFRIGGAARLFVTIDSADELPVAFETAHERGLSVYPLGEGSNVLASDDTIPKAILHLRTNAITYAEDGDHVLVTADGGVRWDTLVEDIVSRGLWGIENLAAIPGTVGAAPVQNIGAYGQEVMEVIACVEAYDPAKGAFITFENVDCGFRYRDSRFKHEPGRIITRVTFRLSKTPRPQLSYPDLAARVTAGEALETPEHIAAHIRDIRAQKFPDLTLCGTAGSFFKNPVMEPAVYAELCARYPGLPGFETDPGIKVPLAWILDHVLSMRGYQLGPVRLFERQPLVVVAERNATSRDVDALANIVATRVHDATQIAIEREVQTLA